MAQSPLLFLPLLALLLTTLVAASTTSTSASTTFIKSKCGATKYPALCIEYLSAYAAEIQKSPKLLAETALSISIVRARHAKSYVTELANTEGLKPREVGAMQDCLEELGDTVDELGKSARELKRASRANHEEFYWRISNVETWISAAITDDSTCFDGFARPVMDGKIKKLVRAKVTNVLQCTSNALALITQYANTTSY